MTDLSQSVADYLLAVEKVAANAKYRVYPGIGGRVEVPLKSLDGHEAFLLNINRGRVLQAKVTYQTRARSVIVLARLDFGVEHRNPDGAIVGSPHLNLYREGFADKWAYELPASAATHGFAVMPADPDPKAWFDSFLAFCRTRTQNIVDWPSGDLV